MDLSHLENQTKNNFYGLLGYEIFKDYDILFDYKKNTISFIKAEVTEEFLNKNFKSKKQIKVPIEMEAHIPVVEGFINERNYKFGLDCGAETNLIDINLKEELDANMSKLKTELLIGADKNNIETTNAQMNSLVIGGVNFKKTRATISDISHLNEGYKLKLKGLIGYDILSTQPTLISYLNKKVIFLK